MKQGHILLGSSAAANYPACLGGATLKRHRRRCASCRMCRHYPACLGGATLKLHGHAYVRPGNSELPRLFRRGHIEALRRRGGDAQFQRNYPACLGGATLKRFVEVGSEYRAYWYYPACLGGATLKRRSIRCERKHAKRYYPACLGGATLKPSRSSIGATHNTKLPRLFRRDHIEAIVGIIRYIPNCE